MNYPSIHIEGAILSADILAKLDELKGQKPADFNLNSPVKDEIARAWADAQDYWRMFQRRIEGLGELSHGTTETRNSWVVPLLQLLGYTPEFRQKGEEVMGRNFAIAYRDPSRDDLPIHVMGCRDSLDRKRADSGPRLSPHGLVQEYLNLTEHLFAVVTNGLQLRLLRDSSRLVKLSYLEFDLERMFTEGHYADFAILFRLLHATRMPVDQQSCAESLIELYHQDSLEAGSRIRDGLSAAVKSSILAFANGFLNHPDNEALRERLRASREANDHFEEEFYHCQLRLIYRLLFLMVIEERHLVFPDEEQWQTLWEHQPLHIPRLSLREARKIYHSYYSVGRLRNLAGKRYLADARHSDYWIALKHTFRLFEQEKYGAPLGIRPLSGDLFGESAIGLLNSCSLDNGVIIECLTDLSIFTHPSTGQTIRVNYGALNVEEFGSVYEGLLEYDPHIASDGRLVFSLVHGAGRASSGSHYTPDELVIPLIKHSLDYLLADRVKLVNAEIKARNLRGPEHRAERQALVTQHLHSLTVCDVACGSGHILLNAARRIATECAVIIEEEEQPSPKAFRHAIREAIRHCIYGVDLNPLAVELCKVALWLEAHNPNEPLNFLDHHIKCGNAIVGLAQQEELQRGIADEAFKALPGDDKEFLKPFRDGNKAQRKARLAGQPNMQSAKNIKADIDQALAELNRVNSLPEDTVAEIATKKQAYAQIGPLLHSLRIIADLQVAQFYIPKTPENQPFLVTDETYFQYLRGEKQLAGQGVGHAMALGQHKHFFHWFLEFPKIMANGGFDCILGNPPYLGGQALSGNYGHTFCNYVRTEYAPTGLSDLVVFFLRRIYGLLQPETFLAIITTNSITDGDVRKDGLEQAVAAGGQINMAVRGVKWPGLANLVVSLLALHKGDWTGPRMLDNNQVSMINAFFEEGESVAEPNVLSRCQNQVFQGSIFLGDGFLMTHKEADHLRDLDLRNTEVLFQIINGRELNNNPDQLPGRSIINFRDWSLERARQYSLPFAIVEAKVRPERDNQKDKGGKEFWWRFLRPRMEMQTKICHLPRCFTAAATTKYLNFSAMPASCVFSHALYVFTTDRWDLFTVVQSTLHEVWARKYSGSLETRLRYSPSDCFANFAFPEGLWRTANADLATTGERYHKFRKALMHSLWLGLTKVYNQFHNQKLPESAAEIADLDPKQLAKKFGKETANLAKHLDQTDGVIGFDEAVAGIRELRRLHQQMDQAVLAAYGWDHESPALLPLPDGQIGVKQEGLWPAIDLRHDFYQVEYLPENDRVRYTIHPDARKEILRRLLLLNHQIHAQELAAGLLEKKKPTTKRKTRKTKPVSPDQQTFGF
jgi:hypothetical protein